MYTECNFLRIQMYDQANIIVFLDMKQYYCGVISDRIYVIIIRQKELFVRDINFEIQSLAVNISLCILLFADKPSSPYL